MADKENPSLDRVAIAKDAPALNRTLYELVPDPRLLITELFRCVAHGLPPERWVVEAMTDWLPKGTDGQGRGKPTLNEAILNFAKDLERAVHVVLAKEDGVSHRESFQAVADDYSENESPLDAGGSDATMRRAYYRMLPFIKKAVDEMKQEED